ncbi:MAG: hypothetical protein PHF41_13170 [Massilibacteroides sp.]|nr:hypothetical protein [Massilibacteroides sp.]
MEKINMLDYGKKTDCLVFCVHVKIKNIDQKVKDLIYAISDTSWVNKLQPADKAAYKTRADRTIKKIVDDIFKKISNPITDDCGEYLVSMTAADSLESQLNHKKIPLAELWKEKVIGNPGFDFHTESNSNLISFGEAKYSGSINPYTKAINQIKKFINIKKDISELSDLKNFASKKAIDNTMVNKKAYVAAFSINGTSYKNIFDRILKKKNIDQLLVYPELYLIGVEI